MLVSRTGFDLQIDKTLEFEGGYVNDPDDPGGETNFGISKRSYPNRDIKNMARDEAVMIYFADFWLAPKYHLLPPAIGAKVFDLGVNMGPRSATKLLQRAINAVNDGAKLNIDGDCGPRTAAAARRCDEKALLEYLRALAADHYRRIVDTHPSRRKFLRGWLRRATA